MLSYWSQEMQKIKAFRLFNRTCTLEGKPLSLLGFTRTDEGVDLHLVNRSTLSREPVYRDLERQETHREQITTSITGSTQSYLWARKVHFGSREVAVKSSRGTTMDMGQMSANWLLAEALRQGWDAKPFENEVAWELYLSSMTLDIQWSELEDLLEESPIRLERDEDHRSFVVAAEFDLPFSERFAEPIVLNLADDVPQLEQAIVLQGMALVDLSEELKDYYPQDAHFAVVTYEAVPEISIQCYASEYLSDFVSYSQTGSMPGMIIHMKNRGELGPSGLPLKNCVIQFPLKPDAERLKFEVLLVHLRVPLEDILF